MSLIGFVYNALVDDAPPLIDSLVSSLDLRGRSWVSSAYDVAECEDKFGNTSLIVVAGGDGTILRTVHSIAPYSIPVVAVNMGRVGFMSELRVQEAEGKAALLPQRKCSGRAADDAPGSSNRRGRQRSPENGCPERCGSSAGVGVAHLLDIDTVVDGEFLTTYRADALVVSHTHPEVPDTPLSAGGPIFFPEALMMMLQPVAAHTGLRDGLVLPEDTEIVLSTGQDKEALVSVDGMGRRGPSSRLQGQDFTKSARGPVFEVQAQDRILR